MLAIHPTPARAPIGRHAADEPEPVPAPASWWHRLLPAPRGPVDVATGQLAVRVRGPLDDDGAPGLDGCLRRGRRVRPGEVVLARMEECDFVNARGFRALVRLQDEVGLAGGRLVVLDPPRSLRLICRTYPHRLVLVPGRTP